MAWLDAITIAATVDGHWRPGIGDPTPLGWLTVLAYLTAAAACAAAALDELRRPEQSAPASPSPLVWLARERAISEVRPRTTSPRYWWLLAALLLVLGVNKQLDLQTAITEIGRRMASDGGWYARRAVFQKAFILGVVALGLGTLVVGTAVFRRSIAARPLSAFGAVSLVIFVVVRAASFHHVDRFLEVEVAGLRWNWILELGGSGLVLASAARQLRHAWRA